MSPRQKSERRSTAQTAAERVINMRPPDIAEFVKLVHTASRTQAAHLAEQIEKVTNPVMTKVSAPADLVHLPDAEVTFDEDAEG